MSGARTRLVHFGIDGGSFGVLDRLASRGLMPGYARLRAEGGRAVLRSTTPWFTVPGWITWMTGVPAEQHGRIYWTATAASDYWERRGAGGRFVTAADVGYPTVFRVLSDAGVSVASVNMPVTFPPAPIHGVMIAGFGSPPDLERAAYPRGYLRRYPDYRIDLDDSAPAVLGRGRLQVAADEDVARYAAALRSMAEARHRVTLDLIAEGHGLVSVVYVGPDRLSHVAWPQVAAILARAGRTEAERSVEAYFVALDRLLGETAHAAPDAVFVVTSDHGQGAPPPWRIAPNVWLEDRGWLVLHSASIRRATRIASPRLRRWLWNTWRRARNIPVGTSPHVDWERTVAYAISMSHCRVFGVAVRGGRHLQEEVAAGLMEMIDPETGLRPVERVVLSEDVCRNGGRARYPEVVAFLRHEFGATGRVTGDVVHPTPDGPSGYHEPEGILLARGPGVDPGVHEEASIVDLAPTLLAVFGVASPSHIETAPIPWLAGRADVPRSVDPGPEPVVEDGLTDADEALIVRHLRDLGYVD